MKTFVYSLLIAFPLCSFQVNTSVSSSLELEPMSVKKEPTATTTQNNYQLHKDVVMNTQGSNKVTYENSALILPDFKLIGPCSFADNEKKISFLAYYTSRGVSFYAPSNASNIIKNYRCNGTQYEAQVSPAEWTATRFRVLLPSNKRQQAIYAAYEANSITDLSGAFFKGISEPSSSAARYSVTEDATSNIFNTTDAYLIWAKIPTENGSVNALIRVKEVKEDGNLSALTFDLLTP